MTMPHRSIARLLFVLIACAAVFCAPARAQAPISSLQLTFAQPDATVSTTDSIPVMLRLTNTSSSQFVVDNTLPNLGLLPSDLPSQGYYTDSSTGAIVLSSFTSYSNALMGFTFGCSSTFSISCVSGPPYLFEFEIASTFSTPFLLAAGTSLDFLFGTFIPLMGSAPPGTYSFYDAGVYLFIGGKDAAGRDLTDYGRLARTCEGQFSPCPTDFFTRTVAAVPEPAEWALMALGFSAIGWRARRAAVKRSKLLLSHG